MAVSPIVTTLDILEMVTFCRTAEGQNQQNRTFWACTAITGGGILLTEAAATFSQDWSDLFVPIIPTTHSYLGLKLRRFHPTIHRTQFINSIVGQGAGDLTDHPLPSQVCGLISKRASSAPPRHRGRFYVPSTSEVFNDTTGDPTAAYATALVDLNAYLRTPVTQTGAGGTATFEPRIVQLHEETGDLVDSWLVDSCLTRSRWATQRRRSEINRPDVQPF